MPAPTSLKSFCAYLLQKYPDISQVSEELKAEEFRQCYFAGVPADLFHIQAAAYICGVSLKSLPKEKFPNRLRGYNDIDERGRRTIYFAQHDAVSGIQNTILHELREIMEQVLAEVVPSYQPLNRDARHIAANHFATAVLLPQPDFLDQVYQTGLDVFALSQIFEKSCSQILLRMGEVLKGKLPFCGALYEPLAERPEQWVVSYSVSTANHPQHYVGWLKSDGFFMPKGQTVKPGSVVDRTLRTGKSHLIHYRLVQEQSVVGSWLILAQPLVQEERVSKVAVVMLPAEQQEMLRTQIESLKPEILEPADHYLLK